MPTYTLISSTELSSTSTTITFSSIPSGYTDLEMVGVGHHAGSSSLNLRINGNTGSVYYFGTTESNTSSAQVAAYSFGATLLEFPANGSTATTKPFRAVFPDYLNSYQKNALIYYGSGGRSAGTLFARIADTNPITSITLTNTLFYAGTTISLYGISAT